MGAVAPGANLEKLILTLEYTLVWDTNPLVCQSTYMHVFGDLDTGRT